MIGFAGPRLVGSRALPPRRSRRLFQLAAAVAVGSAALAACSPGGISARQTSSETRRVAEPAPAASGTVAATANQAPSPTAAPSTSAGQSGRGTATPFTVAFGGDVHFEGVLRSRLVADADSALGPIAGILRSADLAMVNLETAVTTRGTAAPKQFTFRAPPSAFDALRAAGIDVATNANNHGMDFGPVGLRDTLDHARAAHFPLVGSGLDDREAFAPYRVTVHGNRVAVLAATQVLDDNLAAQWSAGPEHAGLASAKNPERLVAAVRSARQSSDTVIVYLHWGQERMSCPTRAQQELAAQLVGAGADIVVGSHAHVQLAGGWYAREGQHGGLHGGQAAYVDYGLGNFVFYASGTGPQTRAGVLLLTVAGRTVRDAQWLPATVQGGVPVPVPASRAAAAVHMWDSLRACTSLSATPPPQDDS